MRYVYPEALAKRPSAPAVGDALRQEAVRRARDTGGLAATPPVPSTLDPQGSPVIMVYLPLYTGGTVPATLEERQRLYAGAAFLSLKPDRLLESLFDHTLTPADAVRLLKAGDARRPALHRKFCTLAARSSNCCAGTNGQAIPFRRQRGRSS